MNGYDVLNFRFDCVMCLGCIFYCECERVVQCPARQSCKDCLIRRVGFPCPSYIDEEDYYSIAPNMDQKETQEGL